MHKITFNSTVSVGVHIRHQLFEARHELDINQYVFMANLLEVTIKVQS